MIIQNWRSLLDESQNPLLDLHRIILVSYSLSVVILMQWLSRLINNEQQILMNTVELWCQLQVQTLLKLNSRFVFVYLVERFIIELD